MRSLFLLLLPFALLEGQPAPGLQCTFNANTPPTVRSEGITELVGDLTMQCTGQRQTPGPVNVQLFLNTPIANLTSRPLGSSPLTDALLLIDDPSPAQQKLGQTVFQGRKTGEFAIEWDGIPIDAPGTTGVRLIRMTNVRANAAQLGLSSTLIPTQIVGFVQVTGSPSIAINNPQQTLAFIQQGLTASVTKPATFNDCKPQNQGVFPGTSATRVDPQVVLSYRELFTTALKTRVAPDACAGKIPVSAECTSETGFFNPALGTLPGQPANGTLIRVQFSVPNFSVPYVTANPLTTSSAGVSAQLITPFTLVEAQSTDGVPIAQLPVENNSATAIWEVRGSNPAALGTFNFGAWVTTTSGGTRDTSPTTGPYIVNMSFAPTADPYASQPDPNSTIPRFIDPAKSYNTGLPIISATVDPQSTFHPSPGDRGLIEVIDCFPSGPSLSVPNASSVTFNYYSDIGARALAYGYLPIILGEQGGLTGLTPSISDVPGMSPPAGQDVTASKAWLSVALDSTSTPTTAHITVDPTGLAPGSINQENITITADNGQNVVIPVTLNVPALGPAFERGGVAQAANYVRGFVSPGLAAVIFGKRFGPATLAGTQYNADGSVATTTGNTRVLCDGVAAPTIYAVDGQVAFFVPFAVAGKATTDIVVEYNGVKSPAVTVPVVASNPSLFAADATGSGQVAAYNQDLSLNGPDNPAARGDTITFFGTGAGQMNPAGHDGAIAAAPLPSLQQPMTVTIDGLNADVSAQGPAVGLVEGLFRLDVKVPDNAQPGNNVQILVTQNGVTSQLGNTIAVK